MFTTAVAGMPGLYFVPECLFVTLSKIYKIPFPVGTRASLIFNLHGIIYSFVSLVYRLSLNQWDVKFSRR